MDDPRFPRNNREGMIYGSVIAAITAYLMIAVNLCRNMGGFEIGYLVDSLVALPFVWVAVMLLMNLLVGRVSGFVIRRYASPDDSANSGIVLNIVVCVTMMSLIMTALGPVIGTAGSGGVEFVSPSQWTSDWPVNFFAAFWIELLFAQPAARKVMSTLHARTA